MKKILALILLVILTLALSVGVAALTWTGGDNYYIHVGANYSDSKPVKASPALITVNNDGSMTFEQAGYWKAPYTSGGVWTNEPVSLDGLSVEIYFHEVPIPTNDCWFAVHLLNKAGCFTTDGSTMGYKNLIRFGDPKLEYYLPAWGGNGSSDIGGNDGIFALQTGDTLTMNVEYKYGQYFVSYIHKTATGTKTFEVPDDKTFDVTNEVFVPNDGKAHISILGSLLGEQSNFKYTVKVREGVDFTEEQKVAQEFEQSKGTVRAEISTYIAAIAKDKANADEAIAGKLNPMDDYDIQDAYVAFEEAAEEAEAALALLDAATNANEVDVALRTAEEAKAKSSKAVGDVYDAAEFLEDYSEEQANEDVYYVDEWDYSYDTEDYGYAVVPEDEMPEYEEHEFAVPEYEEHEVEVVPDKSAAAHSSGTSGFFSSGLKSGASSGMFLSGGLIIVLIIVIVLLIIALVVVIVVLSANKKKNYILQQQQYVQSISQNQNNQNNQNNYPNQQ